MGQIKINNNVFKHKYLLDLFSKFLIFFASFLGIVVTFFILFFIIYKSIPALHSFGFWNFIFNKVWYIDSIKNQFYFGAFSFIISTLLVIFIAMLMAIPMSIFSAFLISEFLGKKMKRVVLFIIEILAGVPPAVFGLFGLEVIGKFYVSLGAKSPANLLTSATILSLMAIPTIISLICNALNSVPQSYKFASLAIGASKITTSFKIVRRSIKMKIIVAVMFGICRVIGEVTAMMMISGLVYQNPNFKEGFINFIFSGIATLSVVIGVELPESASNLHTSALFALGLILIIFITILNVIILTTYKMAKNQTQGISYFLKIKQFYRAKSLKKHNLIMIVEDSKINNEELLSFYKPTKKKSFHQINTKISNIFLCFLMILFTFMTLSITLWIFVDILVKGIQSTIFLQPYRRVLKGVYELKPLFASTMLLIVCSLCISLPIGIFSGIYLNEYSRKNSAFSNLIRFSVDALAATPSIVFGMFGYIVFVNLFSIGYNFISAGLMFSILTLPIIIKNTEEALSNVSQEYRYCSLALGSSKIGMIFKTILPNCKKSLVTGIIYAMSKVISETAPVLLTLSSSPFLPKSLLDPGSTLTTKLFQLVKEPDFLIGPATFISKFSKITTFELAKKLAYELAVITIALVFSLNLLVKYIASDRKIFLSAFQIVPGEKLWRKISMKK